MEIEIKEAGFRTVKVFADGEEKFHVGKENPCYEILKHLLEENERLGKIAVKYHTELTSWMQMAIRWHVLGCPHSPRYRGIIKTLVAMGETEEQAAKTFKRLSDEYAVVYKCPCQAFQSETEQMRAAIEEFQNRINALRNQRIEYKYTVHKYWVEELISVLGAEEK